LPAKSLADTKAAAPAQNVLIRLDKLSIIQLIMLFEDIEFNAWDGAERKAQKAFELYENGQLFQALDKLDAAIEINPANGSWHFNKALTLDSLEHFDQAILEYKRALELTPDDLEILNSLAVDYTRTGYYDLAIQIFEQIQQIDPTFEPCYCNRIITYTEMGKHNLAEQMFYLAQQINPDCPLCYYNIGNSLFGRQNYKKAIWCWQRTALLEPTHPQINYRIAQAHWADGNYDPAHEHFLAELRSNPGDIDVLLDFGLFLLELGHIDSAKEKFNRILELDPDFAAAFHYLGEIALNTAQYDRAVELFQLAMTKDHKLPGPRYRLAQCALMAAQPAKAKELLLAEIHLGAEDSQLLISMGSMLLQIGESDAAAKCLLKVADADRKNISAIYYLAVALAMRGRYYDAIDFFEHILEIKPDDLAALRDCALAYLLIDRPHEAADKLRSARSIAPNDHELISLHYRIRWKLITHQAKGVLSAIKTLFITHTDRDNL